MKIPVDNKKVFGALYTEISKTFDCISHYYLIAKLHAYGLSFPALKLVQDNLQNRKQMTKAGTAYSNQQDILAGVPQGSILGPILLKIFLCDLFLYQENNYFTNYGDDRTPYVVGDNTTDVLSSLTKITQEPFTWFASNQMKANRDKYHLFLSSHENANIQIANATIQSSTSKKLLGVTIGNKLKFDKHVENICQKLSRKLNVLARLVNYMDLPRRRILMNAFFNAQFNY